MELGGNSCYRHHEIDVIQKICNRVVVMEHGKLIESGLVISRCLVNLNMKQLNDLYVPVIPDEIPSTVKHTLACDKGHIHL